MTVTLNTKCFRYKTTERADGSYGGSVARLQGRVWATLGLASANGHPRQSSKDCFALHSAGEGKASWRCQGNM